jgi:hypothetical protein
MTFHVDLRIENPVRQETPEEPDWDLDLVALHTCEALEETGTTFAVSGFGDPHWPVDVQFDLASVVPQLPQVMSDLAAKRPTEINFYEQGVQRIVEMTPQGSSTVLLHCKSFGNWVPLSADETMKLADLEEMLGSLAFKFAGAVAKIYPELATVPPLPQWLDSGPQESPSAER